MKVTILNSYYFPNEVGGAEHSVRSLAEALTKTGNDVTVICLGENRTTDFVNGVRIERMPIRNSYLPSMKSDQQCMFRRFLWHFQDITNKHAGADVSAVLAERRPDVLHTNNVAGFSTEVWNSAKAANVPMLHTVRDFYMLCPKTTMEKKSKNCHSPCITCTAFTLPRRFATKSVNHVVGISEFILSRHIQNGYFSGVPTSVIHNSFDAGKVIPPTAAGGLVFGFIGRLVPLKGVEILIDALRRLVQSRSTEISLIIAGEGNETYVSTLKARARGLPITFIGKANKHDFFSLIDITVVPSIWEEPFGRAVIESFAYGKPVIATPVGGLPELIKKDTGLLAGAPTAEALQTVMTKFLAFEKITLSLWGKKAIAESERFRSAEIASQYQRTYQSVIMKDSI